MNKIGTVILAAGRGKRMNSKSVNKVTFPIAKKPMILHSIDLLEQISVFPIIIVVGFAKKSVEKALESKNVIFAHQKELLGTAHALMTGLKKIPSSISNVLVLQGDDSVFYTEELIKKLIGQHLLSNASLTFLTLELNDPSGLGRVVRNAQNQVLYVIEERDATDTIRKIKEVNPALYVFKVSFLNKFLKKIKKSKVTGEYYLTSMIDIAVKNKEHIETLREKAIPWRGINTPEELQEAERLFVSRM